MREVRETETRAATDDLLEFAFDDCLLRLLALVDLLLRLTNLALQLAHLVRKKQIT